MATSNKSSDDCYFYYYSTCTKGDRCPFRHCEAALGKETVCPLWKEGRCFSPLCQYRHMENRKNRSQIPCYWENQPGGCRKPHCVFMHLRPKAGPPMMDPRRENPGNIIYCGPPEMPMVSHMALPLDMLTGQGEDAMNPTQQIAPVVVNFDDQESDNESNMSVTPIKVHPPSSRQPKGNHRALNFELEKPAEEIKVKTLEEIRLEKIHKESINYYETPPIDVDSENMEDNKNEFSTIEVLNSNSVISPDLRSKLKRKRFDDYSNVRKENSNFHIKTLVEIRKEKEDTKKNSTTANAIEVIVKMEENDSIEVKPTNVIRKRLLNRKRFIKMNEKESVPNSLSEKPISTNNVHSSTNIINAEEKNRNSQPSKLIQDEIIIDTTVSQSGLVDEDSTTMPASKMARYSEELSSTTNSNKNIASTTTKTVEADSIEMGKIRRSTVSSNIDDDLDNFLSEDDDGFVLSDENEKDDLIEKLDQVLNS